MPTHGGLMVHVCDNKGKPLEEYGTKILARAKRVSCYIESKTDLEFRIKMRAKIPFPFFETSTLNAKEKNTATHHPDEARTKQQSGILHTSHQNVPFHLLATLYLDGNEEPERSCIIYLDPSHEDFAPIIMIKSRWMKNQNGALCAYNWVFKEIGIETLLDKLFIQGDILSEGDIPRNIEDEFTNLMDTKMNLEQGNEHKNSNGVIKIELKRIVVGFPYHKENYHPNHTSTMSEKLTASDATNSISHTAKLGASEKLKSNHIRVVNYRWYGRDESPYATFFFFYRGREILEKMSLINQTEPKAEKTKTLNNKFAAIAPLSILNGSDKPDIETKKRTRTGQATPKNWSPTDSKLSGTTSLEDTTNDVSSDSEGDDLAEPTKKRQIGLKTSKESIAARSVVNTSPPTGSPFTKPPYMTAICYQSSSPKMSSSDTSSHDQREYSATISDVNPLQNNVNEKLLNERIGALLISDCGKATGGTPDKDATPVEDFTEEKMKEEISSNSEGVKLEDGEMKNEVL